MRASPGASARRVTWMLFSVLLVGLGAIACWVLAVAGPSWDRVHAVLLAAAGVCGLVGLVSRRRRGAVVLGLALLAVTLAWDPFRSWLAPAGMGGVTSLYHELTIGEFPWGLGTRTSPLHQATPSAVHVVTAAWMLRGHVAAWLLGAGVAAGLLPLVRRRWRAALALPVVAGLACSAWAMLRAGYPSWSAEVGLHTLQLPAIWEERAELLISSVAWGSESIRADYGLLLPSWPSGLVVSLAPWGREPTVSHDPAARTAMVGIPRGADGTLDAVAALQAGVAALQADLPAPLAQPWRACFAIASTVGFAQTLSDEETGIEAWLARGAGGWWGHPWVGALLELQADCGARAVGQIARRARFEATLDDAALDRLVGGARVGACVPEPKIVAARVHLPEVP